MKIGIKQGIIIGAAVLAFGGLVVQGALATTNPQPVPMPIPATQAATVQAPAAAQNQTAPPANQTSENYVNGMINWMQSYFNQGANGQVTPQKQQGLNQMYSFMRQYSGVMYNMMGGYGGHGGGYSGGGFGGGMM